MSEWTAGGAGVKFEQIGDGIAGTITFFTIEDGKDYNGNPMRQKILDIQPDDGDPRRLHVKKGNMEAELATKLRSLDLDAPRVGDRIAVFYRGDRPSKKGLPAKVYEVAYKMGEQKSTSASDLI